MFVRKFVFIGTLLTCLATAAYTQSLADSVVVPLTVDKGFALQVSLTETLHLKKNQSIRAKIVEPVYAFDREVIPAGTEVQGKITGLEKVGKWKRVSAMLAADFTPLREPRITFQSIVLRDGTRIPIQTIVAPGEEKTVGLDADTPHARKGLKNSLASTVKESAGTRLKKALWNMSPYHPRSLPIGTRLNAVLVEPLDFGVAVLDSGALDLLGSQPPADSIASARLITSLNSGVTELGAPVEAVLTRPLFSPDHRLIFPVGSTLRGKVMRVNAARSFHRNGRMAFSFTTIEPPLALTSSAVLPRRVEGSLFSAQVTHDMRHLHMDDNGLRIVESKKRFIAPAWAFIKIDRALNASADPFGDALLGAYRGKFLKQFVGSESGFGLPGSVASSMVPPVAIGLGVYGAARSVYANFLGRGRNINLPANTPIQIRLGGAVPSESEGSTMPEESTDLQ